MSISANASVLSAQYISQEIRQQNEEYATDGQKRAGTLADGKTVSDAARGTHQGGNAAAERDVVTISEEARNKHKNMSEEQDGQEASGNPLGASGGGSGGDAATGIDRIYKQIKEVKKQLQDAQQRLAQANAKAATSGGNDGARKAAQVPSGAEAADEATGVPSPKTAGGKTADADRAALEALSAGVTSTTEAKAIEQEISLLNQQLQTLYQELQEMQREMG